MTPGGKHSHNYNHHNHRHYYHHCYSIKNSTHKNALAAIQPVTSAVVYTCTLDETGVHARRIGQHPEGRGVLGDQWYQLAAGAPGAAPYWPCCFTTPGWPIDGGSGCAASGAPPIIDI